MGRAVRCVVLVVLLLWCVAGPAAAASPFERPAAAVRELVSKRTAESRTWELPSGERVTQVASGPVQWRDRSGEWHEYDLSLRQSGKGWAAQSGPVSVDFPARLDGSADGAVGVADDAGNAVTVAFVGAASEGSVTDEVVSYHDVAPGVDLSLRAIAEGVKEDLLLHDRDASRDLSYRLTTSSADLVLEEEAGGGLRVVRGKTTVFVIPAPTLFDDARAPASGRFELRRDGERSWVVRTVLPEKWLNASERAWPVVVDPTLYTNSVSTLDDCNRIKVFDGRTRRQESVTDSCGFRTTDYVGKDETPVFDFAYWETLLRFNQALTVVQTDAIQGATLKLYRNVNSADTPLPTEVHRITVP